MRQKCCVLLRLQPMQACVWGVTGHERIAIASAYRSFNGVTESPQLRKPSRPCTGFTRATCVAFADIDHFKRLNDSYGHDTGDRALRLFARVLQEALRPGDMVVRFGGGVSKYR
ncbi:hypothetical protein C1H71_01830 [Iodobacter fluviatilis]|uniref:diguanylate cyclase n=1 Tax=Iodobacter fluviatilis TaxID=537 RepID=A0A7G3G5T3_9NEIS|nr:hypothetical protein C1H71_01830 [Iodobacter fluviatilis]